MMATFLNDFAVSIDEKWEEIDLFIQEAKRAQDDDEKLYNVICRSVTVLLVAHLEGFTKDLIKNVVQDLNRNCAFSSLPIAIKRTYCKKYLGNNLNGKMPNYEQNLLKLIKKFEETSCQISEEPFFLPNNRNPNAHIIKIVFNNLGISNIFEYLHGSELEEMFSWSRSEILNKTNELREYVLEATEDFPYRKEDGKFGLIKTRTNIKTLWEEFLDQINQKRHSVAHGNVFDNLENIMELELIKLKILFIQFSFIAILISKLSFDS